MKERLVDDEKVQALKQRANAMKSIRVEYEVVGLSIEVVLRQLDLWDNEPEQPEEPEIVVDAATKFLYKEYCGKLKERSNLNLAIEGARSSSNNLNLALVQAISRVEKDIDLLKTIDRELKGNEKCPDRRQA